MLSLQLTMMVKWPYLSSIWSIVLFYFGSWFFHLSLYLRPNTDYITTLEIILLWFLLRKCKKCFIHVRYRKYLLSSQLFPSTHHFHWWRVAEWPLQFSKVLRDSLVHLLHFKLQKNSAYSNSCQKQRAWGEMSHCN